MTDKVDHDKINIHDNRFGQEAVYGKSGRKGNQKIVRNAGGSRSGLSHGTEHLAESSARDTKNDRLAGEKPGSKRVGNVREVGGTEQDSLSDITYIPDDVAIRSTMKDGKEPRGLDRDYMTAVDNGDMETAQKMVDEAAKAAGYKSFVFAAPVKINGTTVYVAAVVDQRPDNKFYMNECIDSDRNYVRIDEDPSGNTKSGVTAKTESGVTSRPKGSSNTIIRNGADSVKTVGFISWSMVSY